MSESNIKLLIAGIVIAAASLWLGCYALSFAAQDNFWFVYPTLITMSGGIIGGMSLVFKATNE